MRFRKWALVVALCQVSVSLLAQATVGKAWTLECGSSSNTFFRESSSLNLRCVSPRFKWSEEWREDEEKYPDKYINTRFMAELIYSPPMEVLCMGFNVQHRFVRSKVFSMELYGGMKFFFVPGPDFINIPYLNSGQNLWYINMGLLVQLNLGLVGPFADIGADGVLTIGTEVDLKRIYKKVRNKYAPPYRQD